MIHRYGVKLGRLWMPWPHFRPRSLWVGVSVRDRYWEYGVHQVVHVQILPGLRFTFDWTFRG